MPRRKLYCPMKGKHCRQSERKDGNPICRLAENPLSEYKECVRDAIYKEKHHAEIWFLKEGWRMRHLFMRGTCFEKGDMEIILDYGGIAIQKNKQNGIRIREPETLKSLLQPLLPDWLIEELSKKIKNENK